MLAAMMQTEVDPVPAVRARMISAVLIGGDPPRTLRADFLVDALSIDIVHRKRIDTRFVHAV